MKNIIGQVIITLLSLLNKEDFKRVADALLDKLEDSIKGSKTKLDDLIALPLINKVRELLDIPDGEE